MSSVPMNGREPRTGPAIWRSTAIGTCRTRPLPLSVRSGRPHCASTPATGRRTAVAGASSSTSGCPLSHNGTQGRLNASLPRGGRIVIHELLVDDDKCGPLRVAAVNLLMSRLYTRGRQYSGARMARSCRTQDSPERDGNTRSDNGESWSQIDSRRYEWPRPFYGPGEADGTTFAGRPVFPDTSVGLDGACPGPSRNRFGWGAFRGASSAFLCDRR